MIFEDSSNRLGVLDVFLCNDGQIGDLVPIIGDEVFKRIFVVISDLIRGKASRHGLQRENDGQGSDTLKEMKLRTRTTDG
jgi:hypothetical protein